MCAAAVTLLVATILACSSPTEGPILDVGAARDMDVDRDVRMSDDGSSLPDTRGPTDADVNLDAADTNVADANDDMSSCAAEPCPLEIDSFPYRHSADTTESINRFDGYPSCAPDDESGPEIAYRFQVSIPGTLAAGVTPSGGVDVDIHLLEEFSADRCLRRDDEGVSAHLAPGEYFLVVDSNGVSGGGPYELHVDFLTDDGPCAMVAGEVEPIGSDDRRSMPVTGRVALSGHLVTEDELPNEWPASASEEIDAHYLLSETASGYSMVRSEPWARGIEPSSEFGQGSSVRPPTGAEAWYLQTAWRTAPTPGERIIVFDPTTGEAVVAAAGYANGIGDTSGIGGACEEIHDVLGTGHLSTLTLGVAVDQRLPYGPIDCR